jgi:hypothetical protein
MDMLVLCRCGHPARLHNERGCCGSRYHPCLCRLDFTAALETAIASAATRNAGETPKRSELHK